MSVGWACVSTRWVCRVTKSTAFLSHTKGCVRCREKSQKRWRTGDAGGWWSSWQSFLGRTNRGWEHRPADETGDETPLAKKHDREVRMDPGHVSAGEKLKMLPWNTGPWIYRIKDITQEALRPASWQVTTPPMWYPGHRAWSREVTHFPD